MMKWEPLFAHLLKLFIDTERLKKRKDNKRFASDEVEHDYQDQKKVAEN